MKCWKGGLKPSLRERETPLAEVFDQIDEVIGFVFI